MFNTPPTISSSTEMFLNKRNIINVSISRARDYLFIVMPNDNTENVNNLRLVKKVENLIHSTEVWNEFLTPDLENLMFNDSNYLENNTFSTSHQSVNVYGLPEKTYEVRMEDSAVDVQIHRSLFKMNSAGWDGNPITNSTDYDALLNDSYHLVEELIPEELRDAAIDLPVKGSISGWCYLVPYDGKLRNYTSKKLTNMVILVMRKGLEKRISVSVDVHSRIIYISRDMFSLYENALSEPDGIEVREII